MKSTRSFCLRQHCTKNCRKCASIKVSYSGRFWRKKEAGLLLAWLRNCAAFADAKLTMTLIEVIQRIDSIKCNTHVLRTSVAATQSHSDAKLFLRLCFSDKALSSKSLLKIRSQDHARIPAHATYFARISALGRR